MRKRLGAALLVFVSFTALGVTWSFASPPGSTNDEEYHLANIWCSWGEWEGCRFSDPNNPEATTNELSGPVWIPEFLRSVNCYQRGTQSTECLANKGAGLVNSFRQGDGYNPSAYYQVMRTFVGANDRTSLQVVRLLNVAITGFLLGFAVFVSRSYVRRGVVLAWGIAAIPWIVIYASSSNPSAWVIAGTGTAWAFTLSLLDRTNSKSYRLAATGGLALATLVVLSARFDGIAWLLLSMSVAIGLAVGGTRFRVPAWGILTWIALSVAGAVVAFAWNWRRLGFSELTFPEWNRATDQPFPLLKDLLEVPWWFTSFFGTQPSAWIPSNGEPQSLNDGFVPLALTTNLGDMFFPSLVGILLFLAASFTIFSCVPRYHLRTWLVLVLLVVVLLSIVYLFRLRTDFGPTAALQNRYFLPWLMVFLGAALTVRGRVRPLLSRGQALVVGTMFVVGGSVAWLAFASRYAVNLTGTFTNFGQEPVWWWPWGPSRLVWFLIAISVTLLWVVVTLRYAAKPLRELDDPAHSRG